MEGTRYEGLVGGIGAELEVIPNDDGQQNVLTLSDSLTDEVVRGDFIGKGVIEEDSMSPLPMLIGSEGADGGG